VEGRRAFVFILFFLVAAMLGSGVPLRDSLLLASGFGLLSYLGRGAFDWAVGSLSVSHIERLCGGFISSCLMMGSVSYVVNSLGYSGWLDEASVLALLALRSLQRRRVPHRDDVATIADYRTGSAWEMALLLVTLSALAYATWSPGFWPFAACTAVGAAAAGFYGRKGSSGWSHAAAGLGIVTLVTSVIVQRVFVQLFDAAEPFRYLASYPDLEMDETLSWSFTRFGLDSNPFLAGHPLYAGYGLVAELVGGFSRLLFLRPFSLTGSFMVLAGFMATVSLFLTVSRRGGFDSRHGVILPLIVVGFSGSVGEVFSVMEPPRAQHFVGLSLLAIAILFLEHWWGKSSEIAWIGAPIFFWLLLVTKTQLLVVFSVWLMVRTIESVFLGRSSRGAVRAVTSWLVLVGGSWLLDLRFGLSTIPAHAPLSVDVTSLTDWLIPLVAVAVVRVPLAWNVAVFKRRSVARTSLVTLVVALVLHALLENTRSDRHAFVAAVLVASSLSIPMIIESVKRVGRRTRLILGVTGAAAGFVMNAGGIAGQLLHGSRVQNELLRLRSPILQVAVVVVLSAAAACLPRMRSRRGKVGSRDNRQVFLAAFVVASVFSSIGAHAAWSARVGVRAVTYGLRGESKVLLGDEGSRDSQLVAEWLRRNTAPDAILAHSAVCSFDGDESRLTNRPATGTSEECIVKNSSSWLSSWSRRRVYLDRPYNAIPVEADVGVVSERYSTVVGFARDGSGVAYARLMRDGVRFFIVDLSETSLRNWAPYGSAVFAAGKFVVLELSSDIADP